MSIFPRRSRVVHAAVVAASALLLSLQPFSLSAQSAATPASENVGLRAQAAPRSADVRIDGRLDDAAWAAATPVARFLQTQPVEGAPASDRTELRILFDDAAIYVGARMYDSLGRAGVHARLARRDQLLTLQGNNGTGAPSVTSDILVLRLDTYFDRLGQSVFLINPLGVKGDALSIGGSNVDPAWDPVWEGAAQIDAEGWTAEMRIPLSQLRFARGAAQTWGMQVERFVDRRNEWDVWAFWKASEAGGPIKFGTLDGITVGKHPKSLEILPYVLTGSRFAAVPDGDPFHTTSEETYRVGADVRYLLTPNLTLDATFNPDFGQVEADPAVVNLSAYENFFSERRPFFIAGAGAFSFGSFSCYFCSNTSNLGVFYSRRIGRAPQLEGYVDDISKWHDSPDAATILGAAKITGRTRNGWTVGVLDAVTDREVARYRAVPGAPTVRQVVEPMSNYFMGRLRKDYNRGNTVVGGVLTSVVRRLDEPLLEDRLRARAHALGADIRHSWSDRRYDFRSQVVLTDVGGSPKAIASTMRSSARFFQRPDREATGDGLFDARYDTTATALRGYGLYARVAKSAGSWLWETAQNIRSPGFEVNDLGSLSRADYHWMNANLARQWTVPGSWYRNIFTSVGGQQQYNYDGDLTGRQAQVFFGFQLPSYWNWRSFVIHHPVVYDERALRGGPTVQRPGYNLVGFGLTSDNRKRVVGGINGEAGTGIGDLNTFAYINPSATVKIGSNANVDFGPSIGRNRGAQYVTRVTDATATAFGGSRYVFASIDQTSLSMDTRVNVTFSPTLTLEVYAQPFVASGRYYDFEEFEGPRRLKKVVYGEHAGSIAERRSAKGELTGYTIDPDGSGPAASFDIGNPNFSVRSLRGNAVVRWEYRPGSTIFLVWQQSRAGSGADGTFDLGRDRHLLFHDRPTNIFQVKANWWIGR